MGVVAISAIKAHIGGYVGHSAVHPKQVAEPTSEHWEAIEEPASLGV